ncbi:hypothetical protein [Paenibacillus physcomitrellae]|nr:hypothetical protein [Paenibacillus physcomitrellae]
MNKSKACTAESFAVQAFLSPEWVQAAVIGSRFAFCWLLGVVNCWLLFVG